MSYMPKTKQGKAAVRRLGRTKATGGFDKIVKNVEAKGGSAESGKKIAGAIYWGKVRAHRGS